MSNTICHVEINCEHIKNYAFCKIETKAFKYDGVLFGGAVRDLIISEHYGKQFRTHVKSNRDLMRDKNFWNASIHPESAARTLVPDDMDIYFSCKQDSELFIESMHYMCEEENVGIMIENLQDEISNDPAKYGRMLDVQKVTITLVTGRIPFIFRGHQIVIQVDVVTPKYPIMMQPPFNNLDFLCNGFLKTKHGIVYSNDTGTYIDRLTELEKTAEVLKIQRDMIQFKTNLCRFERIQQVDISTSHKNKYAFKRINKLLKKERFPWTICNLPFELTSATKEHLGTECCICQSQFEEHDIVAIVSTTKETTKITCSTTHKHCLMKYLEYQYEEESTQLVSSDAKFIYKCPIRSPIDFTKCACEYKN
jgi:hypothetical protein